MTSLAKMFRDRTDGAFLAAEQIEARLKAAIPELLTVVPGLAKSDIKVQAIVATLREVIKLAVDVQSEIEAGRSHLEEGTEALKEIRDLADEHRRDMAHVTTFARNFKVFLSDPVYLKEIIKMVGIDEVENVIFEMRANP